MLSPTAPTPTRGILAPNQVAKDQRSTMTAKIRVDLWTSRMPDDYRRIKF